MKGEGMLGCRNFGKVGIVGSAGMLENVENHATQ